MNQIMMGAVKQLWFLEYSSDLLIHSSCMIKMSVN
jgi:hypothetical protein